jgi:hypothetical protein
VRICHELEEETILMRLPGLQLLAFALVVAAGCGEKAPSAADTQPFAAAIEQYLAANSMGMKIDSFQSLKIDGDSKAAATVYMSAKDVDYGMKTRWTFTFEKAAGLWRVTKAEH